MKVRDGFIYIVNQENTQLYKIGFTQDDNIKQRLSSLQVGNPQILTFVGCFYTFHQHVEYDLHEYFKDLRVGGEWFKLSDGDIANILDPDWRREKGFYTNEKELIFDCLQRDYELMRGLTDRMMRNLRHLLWFEESSKIEEAFKKTIEEVITKTEEAITKTKDMPDLSEAYEGMKRAEEKYSTLQFENYLRNRLVPTT